MGLGLVGLDFFFWGGGKCWRQHDFLVSGFLGVVCFFGNAEATCFLCLFLGGGWYFCPISLGLQV